MMQRFVDGYKRPVNDAGDDNLDSDANTTSGITDTYTMEIGGRDETVDAGYFGPAIIGDYIWEDVNGDGIQDSNEPALSGVSINLVDEDGASVNDADGNPVGPEVTDDNGAYQFDNLVPGDYKVLFPESTDINGSTYNLTLANADGNNTDDTDSEGDTEDTNTDSDALNGESYVINLVSGEDET